VGEKSLSVKLRWAKKRGKRTHGDPPVFGKGKKKSLISLFQASRGKKVIPFVAQGHRGKKKRRGPHDVGGENMAKREKVPLTPVMEARQKKKGTSLTLGKKGGRRKFDLRGGGEEKKKGRLNKGHFSAPCRKKKKGAGLFPGWTKEKREQQNWI